MTALKRFAIPPLILAIWAMLAGPAWATGCRVIARRKVAVVAPVEVKRTVFVNRFIAVPTPVYLAAYTPPAPCPPAAEPLRAAPAPTYAQPAPPRALPAPPPAPTYEAPPAPRAAPPPPPAYGDSGNNSNGRRTATPPDNTDRILTALERLEERLDDLEARTAPPRRAAPSGNGYAPRKAPRPPPQYNEAEDDTPPPPVRRKAPPVREKAPPMNYSEDDPEDEPPPPPRKQKAPAKGGTRARTAPRTQTRAPATPSVDHVGHVNRIIAQSCSGCHSDSDNARRGNGFILVRGGRVIELTARLRQMIVAEISGGTMPPRPVPPMAPAERTYLVAVLNNATLWRS